MATFTSKPSDMMFTEHCQGFLTSERWALPTLSKNTLQEECPRRGTQPRQQANETPRTEPDDSTWVLWTNVDDECALYHPGASKVPAMEYRNTLRKVGEVRSREELWELWNASYVRSRFVEKEDMYFGLFRAGIAPTWEDSNNEKGGSTRMRFMRLRSAEIVWLNLLVTLTLVIRRESIHSAEINGHVFKSSPWGYNVSVWNRYSHNKKFKRYLQSYLEAELAVPQQWTTYKPHRSKRKPLPLRKVPSPSPSPQDEIKLNGSNQNIGLEGTEEEASVSLHGYSRSDSLTVVQEDEAELHHSNSACDFGPRLDTLNSSLCYSGVSEEDKPSADDISGDSDEEHSVLQLVWPLEEPPAVTRRAMGKPDKRHLHRSSEATFLTAAMCLVLATCLASVIGHLLL